MEGEDARRVVLTYSIAARDADSGELGVAVQSRAFACGAPVMWARPGVGAVATQAFGERSYGPLGLDLLAAGKTPEQALVALVTADEQSDVRQVAMVNADGAVAAHTGEACIADAGHQTGEGYSVQANIMRSPEVWRRWRMRSSPQRDRSRGECSRRSKQRRKRAGTGAACRPRRCSLFLPRASPGRSWPTCGSTTIPRP